MTDADATEGLDDLTRAIAILLYQARGIHDRNPGAVQAIPFRSLPEAWQQDFMIAAKAAVMGLEATHRFNAGLHARAEIQRYLAAEAISVVHDDLANVHGRLKRFIETITRAESPNIVTEVLAAYQEGLCRT